MRQGYWVEIAGGYTDGLVVENCTFGYSTRGYYVGRIRYYDIPKPVWRVLCGTVRNQAYRILKRTPRTGYVIDKDPSFLADIGWKALDSVYTGGFPDVQL